MWSYWLNKIKNSPLFGSITNSSSLAEDWHTQTDIKNSDDLHKNRLNWTYSPELFVGTIILSLVLVLTQLQGWQHFQFSHFFKCLIFINVILFLQIKIGMILQKRLQHCALATFLLINFIFLQINILFSTVTLNLLVDLLRLSNFSHFQFSPLLQQISFNLSLGVLLGALVFRYIYIKLQWISQQQSELQSRLHALQSRINPHFLFNSLNNVISLIAIDPDKAEHMLLNLSRLFRASLQELKLVTLQEEIDLCHKYLEIEKIRLGSRLNVDWKLENKNQFIQAKIPLLTLQPLLENSIFHGVEPIVEVSTINIFIEVINKQVNIIITNPVAQNRSRSRTHHGIATQNIKQRLNAYYGDHVVFRTHISQNLYTTVVQYQYQ